MNYSPTLQGVCLDDMLLEEGPWGKDTLPLSLLPELVIFLLSSLKGYLSKIQFTSPSSKHNPAPDA